MIKKANGFFNSLILAILGGPRNGRGINNILILRRVYYKEA